MQCAPGVWRFPGGGVSRGLTRRTVAVVRRPCCTPEVRPMAQPTSPAASQPAMPPLLAALCTLLPAHRAAFPQERPSQRCVALVCASLFAFARHTVTQLLLALGVTAGDWSAWYRLFSVPRLAYDALC